MGVAHTDNESPQRFDLEKLTQIFLVLLTAFAPMVWISSPTLYQLSQPCRDILSIVHYARLKFTMAKKNDYDAQ